MVTINVTNEGILISMIHVLINNFDTVTVFYFSTDHSLNVSLVSQLLEQSIMLMLCQRH